MEKLLIGKYFSQLESNQYEFKNNYNNKNQRKYKETLCAFLNSRGGQLVFGVEDDGRICGVARSLVDQINLMVDNCYADFVTSSGEQLPHETITTVVSETNKPDTYVVAVYCTATDGTLYQFRTGDVFYRNNASNLRYSGIVYRTESEFISLRQSLEQNHETTLREMQTHYAANCTMLQNEHIAALENEKIKHHREINLLTEKHKIDSHEQLTNIRLEYLKLEHAFTMVSIIATIAIIIVIINVLGICYWFCQWST